MLADPNDDEDKRRCSARTVKQNTVKSSSGVYEVNGIAELPAKNFRSEHVFEVHLVSHFLEWVCGGSSELTYASIGARVPFPDGWTRPDSKWCEAVFGGKCFSLP